MNPGETTLTILATKPSGKPATLLADMGARIRPIEEDEGNVDRYVLSKRLAVERRTGSSFLRGIQDKTVFTSAITLREQFDIPILIVEGEVNYERTSFNPQAVRGALSAMLLSYGMSVLSTPNTLETAKLISMMARHEQSGIPEISLAPKRKVADLADMQRRVIEMLPRCGVVMARDLLQHFGSVRRIANATVAELCSVRGIGAKTAAKIRLVLNAEYGAVDTERNLEDAIEASPELLFAQPVTLLSRQHHIYSRDGRRHIADLVFLDTEADEVILVELKRRALAEDHYRQIRRYLDNAQESQLLRAFVDEGTKIRGILATVTEGEFKSGDKDITVCIIDRRQVIRVLKQLRSRRLVPRTTDQSEWLI